MIRHVTNALPRVGRKLLWFLTAIGFFALVGIVFYAFVPFPHGLQLQKQQRDNDAANASTDQRIYKELDIQTLRSIPDADLERAIADYVWYKIYDYDRAAEVVHGLSPGARAMYMTWVVEGQVNNGGFNQYYYNTDGQFASEAVEAFEYFGATEHAALMREANALRLEEADLMQKFKDEGTLQAFAESYKYSKLRPLDERFLKLTENLSQLRIARVRQSPDQFIGE
jgi:hypothetical protein